jgi:PAS domain S-box-containing protein
MTSEQNSPVRFPKRLLSITLALTFATFWWVVWTTYVHERVIEFASYDLRLGELTGVIKRLDTALTEDARAAAIRDSPQREERHRQDNTELASAIKDAIAVAADVSAAATPHQTEAANANLAAMEDRASVLVRAGRSQEARNLLFSPEYTEQQEIFGNGINVLRADVRTRLGAMIQRTSAQIHLLIAGSVVLFGFSLGAWIVVIRSLRRTQQDLARQVDDRTTELRETADYLQNLIDHANAPIVVWNPALEITKFNCAFERLTGRRASEVLGKRLDVLFPEGSCEESMAHIARTATGECWETVELPIQGGDGSARTVLWNSATVFDADGKTPIATIAQGQDVTERKMADEALLRLNQRNMAILAGAGEGILGLDSGGNHTFVNPSAAAMLGYEVEELIGGPSHSRWHHTKPDGRPFPKEECSIYAALRNGAAHRQADEVFWRKDGTSFSVEYVSTPLLEDGKPSGAVVLFSDTTERRKAADALQDSEDRFRQASSSITDVAYSCVRHPDGDLVTDWVTGATESFSGYSNDEFQALGSWGSLVLEEDRNLFEENVRALAPGASGRCSLRLRKKDGGMVWVASYCRCVASKDEPGQVRLYGGLRDITARKEAEAAQAKSEVRFRTLYESSGDAVMLLDENGFFDCNEATVHMFGSRDKPNFYSKGPADCSPGRQPCGTDSMTLANQRIATAMKEGTHRFEWIHTRLDTGENFPAEVLLSRMSLDGRTVLQATVRDITERKRAQETLTEANQTLLAEIAAREKIQVELAQARDVALEATRLKAEFLANMSHEIRTPLNGIIGMTELVLDTNLSDQQREYVGMVKGSGESLLGIINDILDFSKVEAGHLVLDSAAFALRDSVDDTLRPLALRAQKKGLELFCDVQGDVPDTLVADAGRFRQVLVNLVGNAIKFTKDGEVLVSVSMEPEDAQDPDNAMLHVAVSDTGIGIPADKQSLIFDAFSQADGSITRTYGGTGLGLTISSTFVQLMGGRIWVESTPGRGTTFHFTIRVHVETAEAPAKAILPELAGLAVLVVDDNATNRRILEKTLEKWQMRSTPADSGEAALAAVREAQDRGHPFRLMLLDVMMPGMDGFTVARHMQEAHGLTPPTIMMLSSSGEVGDAARCRTLGIATYLTKPVRQAALYEAILAALGRPSSRRVVSAPTVLQALGSSYRILLAEDNVINQRVGMALLEKAGHTVTLARDGKEALAALAGATFDLVLMDVQMPEMSGTEATAVIRERERAQGGHLPIIALTAHALTGDRERCLAAGADGYVAKPIVPAELFKEIDLVLPRREAPPTRTKPTATFNDADLLARVGGSQELRREVIGLFLEDCPRLLEAVRRGLADGDAAAVNRTAHTLKGSAGNFGAQEVIALAPRLEATGRDGNLSAASALVSTLEAEISRLLEELAAARGIEQCAS